MTDDPKTRVEELDAAQARRLAYWRGIAVKVALDLWLSSVKKAAVAAYDVGLKAEIASPDARVASVTLYSPNRYDIERVAATLCEADPSPVTEIALAGSEG